MTHTPDLAVLGLLIGPGSDKFIRHVLAEGIRADHFELPRHQKMFTAAVAIHDRGEHVDHLTLATELAKGGADAEQASSAINDALIHGGDIIGLDQYVRMLKETATWRRRTRAAEKLGAAVQRQDPDMLATAEAELLAAVDDKQQISADPADLAHRFIDRLANPDTRRWPWPLHELNNLTRGGMRPGQVTLISGPTNHGKSPFTDQCLESAARAGAHARLYMTEMSEQERMERTASRNASVSLDAIAYASSNTTTARKLNDWAAQGGPAFAIHEASGWTAAEICRDARYRRADVVAVDLLDELPLMPGFKRRETAEESYKLFVQLAMQAQCHVIVVCHLNRSRTTGRADIPIPTLGDIRESGQLANGSNNVVFVWREQDMQTAKPNPEGLVILAKARGGEQGATRCYFDGAHQRWLPLDIHSEAAA